jgi:signal transduction histidine kinase
MVSLLGGASGASRVEAWIRVGTELRPGAVWPGGSAPSAALRLNGPAAQRLNGPAAQRLNGTAELPAPDPAARIVPVRHGDDLLGAISLTKPASEPLTSAEDSLLQHLASQASLVMRNAQLTAELRATIDQLLASRRRLVEAQDAERRRIERNLHDGAQQQLIALSIHLGLLAGAADDPEFIRQAVPNLKALLSSALDDLRALARGIYPPLLAEQGLVMALRAQAARSPVPVLLEAGEIGRYPPDTESTVYFCALEALQNVAKHAQASRATVRLSGSDGTLEFSVSDDGAGFPAGTSPGSGLQGMSDRVAAHGGTLTVRSRPGQGTTIAGRLPTSERTARQSADSARCHGAALVRADDGELRPSRPRSSSRSRRGG